VTFSKFTITATITITPIIVVITILIIVTIIITIITILTTIATIALIITAIIALITTPTTIITTIHTITTAIITDHITIHYINITGVAAGEPATDRVPLILTEGAFQGALTACTLTWHHRKDCGGAARLALDLD
jgi:hypothetical protein